MNAVTCAVEAQRALRDQLLWRSCWRSLTRDQIGQCSARPISPSDNRV